MRSRIIFLTLFLGINLCPRAEDLNLKRYDLQRRNNFSRIDTMSWDSLETYLSTVNLNPFYGHRVDSFLSTIPNVRMTNQISSCRTNRSSRDRACVLRIRYYAIMTVEIYVKDFTHMNPSRSSGLWNLSQFEQENIYMIRVYKKYDCVNGSCE